MTWFYISFADDNGFRGATVVEADDANGAWAEAIRRGLNPGGEAAILEVPREVERNPDMLAMRNRLVGRDEMIALGGKRAGDCSERIQEAFNSAATKVCGACNPEN